MGTTRNTQQAVARPVARFGNSSGRAGSVCPVPTPMVVPTCTHTIANSATRIPRLPPALDTPASEACVHAPQPRPPTSNPTTTPPNKRPSHHSPGIRPAPTSVMSSSVRPLWIELGTTLLKPAIDTRCTRRRCPHAGAAHALLSAMRLAQPTAPVPISISISHLSAAGTSSWSARRGGAKPDSRSSGRRRCSCRRAGLSSTARIWRGWGQADGHDHAFRYA
jgi:hypothetical protein